MPISRFKIFDTKRPKIVIAALRSGNEGEKESSGSGSSGLSGGSREGHHRLNFRDLWFEKKVVRSIETCGSTENLFRSRLESELD